MTTDQSQKMAQEAMALLSKREPLAPELKLYLSDRGPWWAVQHPLVYSVPYSEMMNAQLNSQLRYKEEALAKAYAEHDWHTYVFLHERPYRVNGFVRVKREMSDGEYWELLRVIWMDSENIRQNPQIWQRLMESKRGQRNCLMDEDEIKALKAMDDVITVYQGHTTQRHDGWSWTTELKTAEWFAKRFADLEVSKPVVTTATVEKANVIAYFQGRNESEVIARRKDVTILGKVDL